MPVAEGLVFARLANHSVNANHIRIVHDLGDLYLSWHAVEMSTCSFSICNVTLIEIERYEAAARLVQIAKAQSCQTPFTLHSSECLWLKYGYSRD